MNTITKELNDYMRFCKHQKKLSTNTMRAYKIDMEQFLHFLSDNCPCLHSITEISKEILKQYVEILLDKYAPRTCNRKIAFLKAMLNHMEFEDIIPINPFRKLKLKIKESDGLPKTMQKSEVKQQFRYIYSRIQSARSAYQKYCAYRDAACYEVLFSTGVRVGELCGLQRDAVDFETGTMRVCGKGNKERVVYITADDALDTLKAYCAIRDQLGSAAKSQYFFINWSGMRLNENSVRYAVRMISAHTIKRHITPHMFRHTFATLLLENGVDIRFIQELLGHSSIKTTMIYLRLSNAAIRAVLVANHPRTNLLPAVN